MMKKMSLVVAAVGIAMIGCGGGGGGGGGSDEVVVPPNGVSGPDLSGQSALFFTAKEMDAPDSDSEGNSLTKALYNVFRWVPSAPSGYKSFAMHTPSSMLAAFPITVGADLYLVEANAAALNIKKVSDPKTWSGYFTAGTIEKTEYIPSGVSVSDFAIAGTKIYYKKALEVFCREFGSVGITKKDTGLTKIVDLKYNGDLHVVGNYVFAYDDAGYIDAYTLNGALVGSANIQSTLDSVHKDRIYAGSDGLYWFQASKSGTSADINLYFLDATTLTWDWLRKVTVSLPSSTSDVDAIIDSHAGKVLLTPLINLKVASAYEFSVGSELTEYPMGLPNPAYSTRSYGQFMVLP